MFRSCYTTILSSNIELRTKTKLYGQNRIHRNASIKLVYNLWVFTPSVLHYCTLGQFGIVYKIFKLIFLSEFYEFYIVCTVQF
jgi:hypothetical protein